LLKGGFLGSLIGWRHCVWIDVFLGGQSRGVLANGWKFF